MQVLQEGSGQSGWTKEYVCSGRGNLDGGCGAGLLVNESDLRQTADVIYFECIRCRVHTNIDTSTIPDYVVRRLGETNQ